ncbi:MAG TPA: rod shape-determining protein MreC [Bacteroidota bacterium]|nr:rod shape-determining protein MreC [Bacteroidota bacterium]
MLRRAYEFVILFKEYLVFGVLLAVCAGLLALNDDQQIRTIRSVAVVAVGSMQDVLGIVPHYFDLRRENQVLRELNLTLADEVSRLREARLENVRLRGMLGLKEQKPPGVVAANVIGKSLELLRNTVTLDVGEKNGVRVNMPILTEDGLAGKIVATSGAYAVAQILFNREIRVSAKIERSRVDGIIRWDGGPLLTLTDVAKTLDVRTGDVVITSEYSTFFPAGIRIGLVTAARGSEGSLFQSVDVRPAVDFTRLEEVFVLTATPDSERVALERRARE